MSEQETDYSREVRDTIVKSSLTGVFATALVVTVASPAGLGGMIGTSVASGFGIDTNGAAASDPYANLPPFPAPLSVEEITTIRSQLERTAASLELTRAATEAKIEHVRNLALSGAVTFEAPRAAPVLETPVVDAAPLRVTLTAPEPLPVAEPAPLPQPQVSGAAAPAILSYREQHLEFADLLLSY